MHIVLLARKVMDLATLLIAIIQLYVYTALSLSSTQDFVSIDCGGDGIYTDAITNISYSSDDHYIDSGIKYKISSNYINKSLPRQIYETVRSFPYGDRNCYTLNVVQGNKYLIRASFLYGNYDEQMNSEANKSLSFDLRIGSNLWRSVDIFYAYVEYSFELITVTVVDLMWVCLVNTGHGTPFISSLELRPVESHLYPNAMSNQSNAILFRYNYGPTTDEIIRYPDDPFDRIWKSYSYDQTILAELSTNDNISRIDNSDSRFTAPYAVLRTAITPIHSRNLSVVKWDPEANDFGPNIKPYYDIVLYFVELEKLPPNETRVFEVLLGREVIIASITPRFLECHYAFSIGGVGEHNQYKHLWCSCELDTFPSYQWARDLRDHTPNKSFYSR